jgi:hypothetical protein
MAQLSTRVTETLLGSLKKINTSGITERNTVKLKLCVTSFLWAVLLNNFTAVIHYYPYVHLSRIWPDSQTLD